MKKIILTAVAVMAFAFSNAQETRFGVKGGANLANLTGDYEGASSMVGFHVGGFAEIKLSDKFAIQPELLYSAQGAKVKQTFFEETDKYDVKLSYLNIPVLAKYYVTEEFSVEAGPQLGVLLSAKEGKEDAKDYYKSVDFGFNVGAGYNFTEDLSVGVRYTAGLSSVAKTPEGDAEFEGFDVPSIAIRNSVLALSVGYKF